MYVLKSMKGVALVSTVEALGLMLSFGGLLVTIIFGILNIVLNYMNTKK